MPRKKKTEDTIPFGKILKGIMKERGISLKQIASLANVSSSVAQGWLEGANPHDLNAVAKLSQSLGVSFKSLLLGKDEAINKISSISELYEKQVFFEGLCEVSIKRLVPREK